MNRLTFKKWFEHFKPDEETTTILVNGYTQIVEPDYLNRNSLQAIQNYYLVGEAVEKLATYEDAEEKGLLFKMPCKPGDTVFIVITKTREIKEHKVSKIILGKQHDQIVFNGQTCFTIWGKNWNEYFYKYVHFTREAAEKALQQIQEEN